MLGEIEDKRRSLINLKLPQLNLSCVSVFILASGSESR